MPEDSDARDIAEMEAAFGKAASFHWALGRIVMQYAGLQSVKRMFLWELMNPEDHAIGMMASEKLSDRLGLDLFCALFRHRAGDDFPTWEIRLNEMRVAVEKAEDRRNAIVHGMYVWSPAVDDQGPPDLRLKVTARPKRGLDVASEPVDEGALLHVAGEIAAAPRLLTDLFIEAFPAPFTSGAEEEPKGRRYWNVTSKP